MSKRKVHTPIASDAAALSLADDELEALASRIEALSPPDVLRLAAELLELRRPHEALMLIDKVSGEMHLVLLSAERRAASPAHPRPAPRER